MRDVLRSVNDVRRPGQTPASSSDGKSKGDPLNFPQSESTGFSAPPGMEERKKREGAASEPGAAKPDEQPRGVLYHNSIATVDEFLKLAAEHKPFNLDEVAKHAELLVETLAGSDQIFMQALSSRKSITSMAQHSVNVAIVAIKIANGLKFDRRRSIEVGVSGMVHEVGMVRVPEGVLTKRGELTPSEQDLIRRHPEFGREVLSSVEEKYPYLPEVVFQEHERWNGKGYPQGLKENEINEYAQIIGLADSFIALTHTRHYRDNFIAYKAMQSIIERRNVDFSARMIKALIDVISIFPVDSLVKLNNGAIAKVVRTNKNYPVRPVIQLVSDSRGMRVEDEAEIDLSNEPMIYIVSPVLDEAAYS
jgi:HD-GYP domain-containing protein (c-di-GMP phosphodiesterase class II)